VIGNALGRAKNNVDAENNSSGGAAMTANLQYCSRSESVRDSLGAGGRGILPVCAILLISKAI
jgi:hypothetical protein